MTVSRSKSTSTMRPCARSTGLPAIREADLTTRIKGRNVVVNVGRGIVELESGRKLTVSNGVFEVPDTHPKSPPARARLKVEGPVSAAAELVALDRLKEASGAPFDPATSRGNVVGLISVGLPIASDPPKSAVTYTIALDVSNFGAEKMLMGQKVEAQTLKVSANAAGLPDQGRRAHQRHARRARLSQAAQRSRNRSPPAARARRRRARAFRFRCRAGADRAGAGEARGPHDRRQGCADLGRCRSDASQDRQPDAGLGQALRQAQPRDLHGRQQGQDHALRGSS